MRDGFFWELGSCVMTEYDEDGWLGIQIDGFSEDSESEVAPVEALAPFGFMSRPQDPDSENNACRTFYLFDGSSEYSFPLTDPRAAKLIPPLKKGSSVQYALRKNFDLLSFDLHDGETGTKTVYVEYRDDSGNKRAHVLTVGVDANGAPLCNFLHGSGMGVVFFEQTAMLRNAPGSVYVAVDNDGATINGNLKLQGSLSVAGDIAASGEVTANAGTLPSRLSKHIHGTGVGPTTTPTPGT